MLRFLPTRAYRPGTPGATTFLSPLSGTFNSVGTGPTRPPRTSCRNEDGRLTKECPGATTSNCGWDSFACAEFDLTGGGETLVFTDRSQSTPVKNESTSTIKLLITRY